ncbi:DUF3842 family protein [Clostridium sp. AF22-10]|uniref:DUF3842 family protein n=1 Tax=Clostridium sp. AF22-10 TaxID=2293004 RepID=UPI00399CB4C4
MCQGTFFFIILSYENPTKRKGVIHYEKSCHHRRSGRTHGARLVEEIQKLCPGQPLLALGANTTATAAMMKAGAAMGATGENPVLVACRDADLIIGPIGIVIADSLLGEITPAMAAAIGQSRAQKILIPVNGSSYCRHILVGTQNLPMNEYIHLAAEEAAAYLNHI